MDKERFYTVHEVAQLFDVTDERVRQLIRNGELNAFFSSRREGYKIMSSYIEDYLNRSEKEKKKPGRKPKPTTISENSVVKYEKPISQDDEKPMLLYFAAESRSNGMSTALIVDPVNKCFVYDRSWSMNDHRNENIEVFGFTLESVNRLADEFEAAGFKEFGRGFFD